MDDRDWKIISTLYKYKNITKTATTLFISQPALTSRIKQIESSLGVQLIQRSNKGISFTPYGEFAAQFAIQYLKDFYIFKQNLQSFGNEVTGTLKIAVSSIIGRYYLPTLLENFQQLYPKIRYEITITPSSEVNKLVKSHLADFGFTKNASAFEKNNKLLLTTYNALIASKNPFNIEDLPKMNLITYPYEESYRASIWKWWKETFDCPPNIGTKVSNLDISKEMIFAGLGYGILPEILVPECSGPLFTKAMYFKDGSIFKRHTWLIFDIKNVETFPVQKVFYQFMKDAYFPGFLRQRNKI